MMAIQETMVGKTTSLTPDRAVLRQTGDSEGPAAKIIRAGSEDIHIGENTSFEGSFATQGKIFIDGQLTKARVQATQLSIGPRGRLDGEVSVSRAEVGGAFSGRMTVETELVLRSTARMDGEIDCGELIVHRGAALRAQVAAQVKGSETAAANLSAAAGPMRYGVRRRAGLVSAFALGALVAGGMFGTILLFRLAPMVMP